MKARELTIGDLLKWKEQEGFNDDDRRMVLRVTQVCDGKIWIDGRSGPYAESLFEPIPLTAEMLEQNGFKLREGCTSAWDWHNGETSVHISGNHTCPIGQTLTIYIPGGTVGAAYSSNRAISDLKIRGVHELQHALNLCHINKKIKVKKD